MQSTPSPKRRRGTSFVFWVFVAVAVTILIVTALAINAFVRYSESGSSRTSPSAPSASQRYEESIREAIDDYGQAGNEIAALLARAQDNTALLSDTDWQRQVETAFGKFGAIGDRVEGLNPPAAYADAHEDFLLMETSFDNAIDFMREGYQAQDGVAILQGNNLIDEARFFMDRGLDKLP